MKWLNTLIIAGAAQALALTAALAGANLDQIKADGVLKIGTEGTYAPFTYHDSNDKLVGFDVEIGEAIADQTRRQAGISRGQMGRTDRRARRQPLRCGHQPGRHHRGAQGEI